MKIKLLAQSYPVKPIKFASNFANVKSVIP